MGFLHVTGLSVLSSLFIHTLALLFTTAGLGLWISRPFTRNHIHSTLLSATLAIPLGTLALSILFLGFLAIGRLLP